MSVGLGHRTARPGAEAGAGMEAIPLREGFALLVVGSSTQLVEKGIMTEAGS